MAIDSQHPVYKDKIELWQRCRDAYEGEDAVKAQGQKYLPLCDPSQTSAEYAAYKQRAHYFEAVGRTIDGYVGAIARKSHTIELPSGMEDFETDATANGVPLDELIKLLCRDAFLVSRGGILVDFDADKKRSYLQFYTAEQIINWGPDFVVLCETIYETKNEDGGPETSEVAQIRHVHKQGNAFQVDLWRKDDDPQTGSQWRIAERLPLTKRGLPVGEMPFFWLSSVGRTDKYVKPPLLGLVNTALSHFRSSADLEHGRHFTAMPTLYVTGESSDTPIRVGAAAALVLPDANSKVGYAEFVGQGLGSLEKAIDKKEEQMAVLGAAAFAEPKRTFESAAAVRMRMSGENTLLGSIVTAVETLLQGALGYAARWMGSNGAIKVVLNREFVNITLDGQTIQGFVSAYQAGAMSLEAFLFNLQQASMLPPDADIATEAAAAKAQADENREKELAATLAAKPRPAEQGQ